MKTIKKLNIFAVSTLLLYVYAVNIQAQHTVTISPTDGDATWQIRQAIENAPSNNLKIILENSTYICKPDLATEKYCAITNHDNGVKKILFPISNMKNVEIEGNGAALILHGRMFPFLFENCENVTITNLSIDWDIPFLFLGEVVAVNPEKGYRDIKPFR